MRSGGRKSGGYIQKVKDLWDRRGMSKRGKPSLTSQLKTIEMYGGLLSMEREEIEGRVRQEDAKAEEMGRLREEVLDMFEESSDEGDGFYGFEDDGMEEGEQDKEEKVDFVLEDVKLDVDGEGEGGVWSWEKKGGR